MKIRSARAEDAEALLRLRCALWPDLPVDRQRELIRLRAGSGARHETFLAEDDDGTACGFLELTRDAGAPGEPGRAVVDGVFVIPPVRRRGLARRLLEAAERWAHARGAAVLCCALDPREEAQLEAMGWLGFAVGEQRVHLQRAVSAPMEMARSMPADAAAGGGDTVPAAARAPDEPVLVMEPVRSRGGLYLNALLLVVAVLSFLNTDIYSGDWLRGGLLPLLDVAFVLWFLFAFIMYRYRKRADSSARAERLFRDDP